MVAHAPPRAADRGAGGAGARTGRGHPDPPTSQTCATCQAATPPRGRRRARCDSGRGDSGPGASSAAAAVAGGSFRRSSAVRDPRRGRGHVAAGGLRRWRASDRGAGSPGASSPAAAVAGGSFSRSRAVRDSGRGRVHVAAGELRRGAASRQRFRGRRRRGGTRAAAASQARLPRWSRPRRRCPCAHAGRSRRAARRARGSAPPPRWRRAPSAFRHRLGAGVLRLGRRFAAPPPGLDFAHGPAHRGASPAVGSPRPHGR